VTSDEFRAYLESPPEPFDTAWHAVFVDVEPGGRAALERACGAAGVVVVDSIDRQLSDLALILHPRKPDAAVRREFVASHIEQAGDAVSVGSWAFLPWLRTIVHVLAEDDYWELITNRNRDKITIDEQRRLRSKRVGVVGLSVGAEAAVTVAQEHLCGEMVIADFDTLDLSNLNRLHAGCDELGVRKTTITARRIARIDPWLRVRVLEHGVTDANVDEFLDGLDLLIEECDGLAMKFDVRERAKARGIDIVYAADERGYISVEPYGQDPDLPVFHGIIESRPRPRESYESPLEFFRAMTCWFGDWDAISERSRRSLVQVGDVLCGYPQLAGEARWAAGAISHVARRLLLGERLRPGWQQIDLDTLIVQRVTT
jgi:tRNA threonylcarbamoyladenosine dehydratase